MQKITLMIGEQKVWEKQLRKQTLKERLKSFMENHLHKMLLNRWLKGSFANSRSVFP